MEHWCIEGQHLWTCAYKPCYVAFHMNCSEHISDLPGKVHPIEPPREIREKAGRAAERLRQEGF